MSQLDSANVCRYRPKMFWQFIIIGLPFILFFWMCPFVSQLCLGTDFLNYYIPNQMEQQFALRTGTFILYVPGFFGGQSAVALTADQVFNPISHIASFIPGYWEGKAVDCILLVKFLELGATHLFLFFFLTRLNLTKPISFLISTITVYNMFMLLLFWHGAALEAWTGQILLCTAFGMMWLRPQKKRYMVYAIFSVYFIVTNGFPQYAFYGFTGAILFAAFIPYLSSVLGVPSAESRAIRFWAKASLSFAAGLTLSSAYIFPFIDFMTDSTGRIDASYTWSLIPNGTLIGTINSFFAPLKSDWATFGGSPLFLTAISVPTAGLIIKKKAPKPIWAILGAILIVLLYIQGDRTPLYYIMWKYLPFVSAMRGPFRATMVLPILFMLVLVWLFRKQPDAPVQESSMKLSPLTIAALAALVMMSIYIFLPDKLFENNFYSCPYSIRKIPAWVDTAIMAANVIILVAVVLHGISAHKLKHLPEILLCILACALLAIVMRYGPMAIETKPATPTFGQMLEQKHASLDFCKNSYFLYEKMGRKIVVDQLRHYFLEPTLARTYRKWTAVPNHEKAYSVLNSTRKQDEAVIENYPSSSLPDSCEKPGESDTVSLAYSSYNRLVFKVEMACPGFFVLSYPYTGHWRATVDGAEAKLYRANGASHGLPLSAGTHTVEFRYVNKAFFWGMAVSCIALAVIGVLCGASLANKATRYTAMTASLAVGAALFLLWENSLYNGDNLHTEYFWQTPPPDAPVNLAFGKFTMMSSHQPGFPYFYKSRRAVDGDRSPSSCCITARQEKPWWRLDLKNEEEIGTIAIYLNRSSPEFNQGKIFVAWSANGKKWPGIVLEKPEGSIVRLKFPKPVSARYLYIRFGERCRLSLNEVEIYPSGGKDQGNDDLD